MHVCICVGGCSEGLAATPGRPTMPRPPTVIKVTSLIAVIAFTPRPATGRRDSKPCHWRKAVANPHRYQPANGGKLDAGPSPKVEFSSLLYEI